MQGMDTHLTRILDAADDVNDCLGIAARAYERLQAEVAEIRSQVQGQQELPLSGAVDGHGDGTDLTIVRDETGRIVHVRCELIAEVRDEIRNVACELRGLAPSFRQDTEHDAALQLVHRLEALADRL